MVASIKDYLPYLKLVGEAMHPRCISDLWRGGNTPQIFRTCDSEEVILLVHIDCRIVQELKM